MCNNATAESKRETTMSQDKLDRRQVRSRAAIQNAFSELLREKDLSQITVTEIARRADRNRKTFYLHYNSIDDLIAELLQDECKHVVDELEAALRKGSNGPNVSALYDTMNNLFISNFARNADILAHVDHQALLGHMRPLLTKAITENDSLGLGTSLGPFLELFVTYFSSGILSLYSQWVELNSELPLEYLSELAMATAAGGVSALVQAADELHIGELRPEG